MRTGTGGLSHDFDYIKFSLMEDLRHIEEIQAFFAEGEDVDGKIEALLTLMREDTGAQDDVLDEDIKAYRELQKEKRKYDLLMEEDSAIRTLESLDLRKDGLERFNSALSLLVEK